MTDEAEKLEKAIAEAKLFPPEYEQDSACPQCGGPTDDGFGLAGGGYGVYTYCPSCGIITSKTQVEE
jgi:rubredoxin